MSTVTEIKQAVSKLPSRKKRELVRWMQTQVGGDESDESTRVKGMSKEEIAVLRVTADAVVERILQRAAKDSATLAEDHQAGERAGVPAAVPALPS